MSATIYFIGGEKTEVAGDVTSVHGQMIGADPWVVLDKPGGGKTLVRREHVTHVVNAPSRGATGFS